jgi:hypothetical protein
MNRIFISYRTSDGKKDANRLAEDLNRIFGDDQVFFDKHDLQGGAAWRDAIGHALGQRPVVLLLMTPDLFGAPHPDGTGRRIDHADDPIRMELVFAQRQGALIVPLLTEGMVMPGKASLPGDLHFIGEAHALKLRTDDWSHDLGRLVTDLTKQGIQQRVPAAQGLLAEPPARELGAVWVMFWVAVALWILVAAAAEHEPDAETYLGAGFVMLFPLGMFIYTFQRFRAARRGARWAALALAVLSGVMVLGYFAQSASGDAPAGTGATSGYRPPVTSMTAPVV